MFYQKKWFFGVLVALVSFHLLSAADIYTGLHEVLLETSSQEALCGSIVTLKCSHGLFSIDDQLVSVSLSDADVTAGLGELSDQYIHLYSNLFAYKLVNAVVLGQEAIVLVKNRHDSSLVLEPISGCETMLSFITPMVGCFWTKEAFLSDVLEPLYSCLYKKIQRKYPMLQDDKIRGVALALTTKGLKNLQKISDDKNGRCCCRISLFCVGFCVVSGLTLVPFVI
jgi:hypothetical protein